jgi:hypothetical protein
MQTLAASILKDPRKLSEQDLRAALELAHVPGREELIATIEKRLIAR